jgi:hypothetical protein
MALPGNSRLKASVSHDDWCLAAMMTGPFGRFLRPLSRWVRPTVTLSHQRQKRIQNRAHATTAGRGRSRMGAPPSAIATVPAYQPTLKHSERSQRVKPVMLVTPVLVA